MGLWGPFAAGRAAPELAGMCLQGVPASLSGTILLSGDITYQGVST
jgi:hypothetical protein